MNQWTEARLNFYIVLATFVQVHSNDKGKPCKPQSQQIFDGIEVEK